ncbi:phosphoadenosine phosphosulfate reductase family protein [uncultured Herbaspirillum sp.]|uniref:phosphoadenosine phosphosulfate reductase family protein n=1 Tax=uncultured Herbaspirillum sp. TaxID=160236 RepID=UPI002629094B|nr:phosphoadenosine phosphosulfate reductase family protein [uncultured Herbaspirillum sp.]
MSEYHVLGLSGGKDSAALAIFMRQKYPELDIRYFFTDTGKELREVYEFLAKLEGFLGKRIERLNPHRDFDFWLREYGHFLPSAQTRWCTRQLKLLPFKNWVRPWLSNGDRVISYVAIRSDEEHREGLVSQHDNLEVVMPFREHGIDKPGVYNLLDASGVGMPAYYEWRSRSGCTFCFFQQKIEWVRLLERHPDAFQKAKEYEKTALAHGSPFTWSQGESLEELERPERIESIKAEFEQRKKREVSKIRINPLRPQRQIPIDIDDLYSEDEGGGACLVCHK